MAIKKKAAKPAKHATRPSGGSASKKAVKKAAPKKASKPVKAAPKKAVAKPVAKKAVAKPAAKPISKQAPAIKQVKPAAHSNHSNHSNHPKPAPPVKAHVKEQVASKPAGKTSGKRLQACSYSSSQTSGEEGAGKAGEGCYSRNEDKKRSKISARFYQIRIRYTSITNTNRTNHEI